MISRSILFYWSKGAEIRRRILYIIGEYNQLNKAAFLNTIAKKIKLSHAAVKKHIDLLMEEGYIKPINPKGKPVFLELTKSGTEVAEEFKIKFH